MTDAAFDPRPIWITLQLATTTTVILLLLATPLAWWLARTRARTRVLVEALVALPLVLPPTVLGFYLLIALGPRGWVGQALGLLGGGPLVFTFAGLVVGSVIFSLQFAVQPMQSAFEALGRRPLEVAATLRASPVDRFFSIVVPLSRRGYVTAAILSFAHTVGEFGVVLMIGGSIPGRTEVLSIAVFRHVEAMRYGQAHALSLGLLLFSLALLTAVFVMHRRWSRM
jgi:molybdate transport system permease protein